MDSFLLNLNAKEEHRRCITDVVLYIWKIIEISFFAKRPVHMSNLKTVLPNVFF